MDIFLMYMNEDNEEVITGKKECLITRDQIISTEGIELKCGHFFKYESLMKEVEMNIGKSPTVKCPYCRTTYKGVLPYREGYTKQRFVNYPFKYCLYNNKCSRILIRGKRKGETCEKPCEFDKCIKCCKLKPLSRKKQCDHFIKDKQCKLYIKTGDFCHHHIIQKK